jgi:hypothetical protein
MARFYTLYAPIYPTKRCRHDWRTPHSVVGGLRENPGVWGVGAGVAEHFVCSRCGAYKVEHWEYGRLLSREITQFDDLPPETREKINRWQDGLRKSA